MGVTADAAPVIPPANTPGSADAYQIQQQAYIDAIESRDTLEYMKATNPDSYKMLEMDQTFARMIPAMNDYFSTGPAIDFLRNNTQRADYIAMGQIQETVSGAIYSSDTYQQAKDVLDLFDSLSKAERNSLNSSNMVNTLASSNGIGELLSSLRELIDTTRDNGRIRYMVE